jgi:small nuclear ribonucleoprotein (snRNP)-like protein
VELVVLALGVLVIAAGVVWHIADLLWARRLVVRRRVLVQLDTGRAVVGTLWSTKAHRVVIKNAQLLEPGNEPTHMDGDVVIERARVEYVQAVGD